MYKVVKDNIRLGIIDKNKPLFADIETQDLYFGTRLIQLYQTDLPYVLIVDVLDNPDLLQEVKELLMECHTVFYNGSYDLSTLKISPSKVDDLYYATKIAYPLLQKYNFDLVVKKLGIGSYGDIDKKALQKQGFKGDLTDEQLEYSALDVIFLAKLWDNHKIQDVLQNNEAYELAMKSQGIAMKFQQNGMLCNLEERDRLLVEVKSKLKEAKANLLEYTGAELNVNSPKQVTLFLGVTSSSKDVLVELGTPEASLILEIRSLRKQESYLTSLKAKMFAFYNVLGAGTGRFTCSGSKVLTNTFNAQQIPRAFQHLFEHDTVVDGEETKVIHLDYATIEVRVAANVMKEPVLAKQLIDGLDIHTETAKLITGKDDITKAERTQAKSVVFGYLFGMSYKTFVTYAKSTFGIDVTLAEAQEMRKKFLGRYPMISKYHKRAWENYDDDDYYVETVRGYKTKPRLGTDAINAPVQGSAADVMRLALVILTERYPETTSLIYNVIHDCILARVKVSEYDMWLERFQTAMVEAWTETSKLWEYDIPIEVSD